MEQVFSWPGLGLMTMSAISGRDYPVIMGVCLLSAVVVLAANLITDILYALVDPANSVQDPAEHIPSNLVCSQPKLLTWRTAKASHDLIRVKRRDDRGEKRRSAKYA